MPIPIHDKLYLVWLRGADASLSVVIAASAEIHGEHLVLLKSDGRLAALFVRENVEGWSEFEVRTA